MLTKLHTCNRSFRLKNVYLAFLHSSALHDFIAKVFMDSLFKKQSRNVQMLVNILLGRQISVPGRLIWIEILFFLFVLVLISFVPEQNVHSSHKPIVPCTCNDSSTFRGHSGNLVTTDESALSHHYHPKPIDYIMSHSWCYMFIFIRFDKCMIHIYLYSIIQKFPNLKHLWALPPLLLAVVDLNNFAFSRMLHGWNHIVCSRFRLASFT